MAGDPKNITSTTEAGCFCTSVQTENEAAVPVPEIDSMAGLSGME
jgi:hypothetical protein